MSYSIDRNCDKCIHHTSGMCDSWDCKMQTVEGLKKEVREKAIEEFAEKVVAELEKSEKRLMLRNGNMGKTFYIPVNTAISIVRGKE